MKETLLIIFSAIGFAASFYIFYSKRYNRSLYCPIGENCDDVVRSKYGKTFGVENTIPGMMYYLLILTFALFSNRNIFKQDIVYYFVVGISFASVAFSLYLTYVQKFILKKWCYYCIISTISSILILGVLVYG